MFGGPEACYLCFETLTFCPSIPGKPGKPCEKNDKCRHCSKMPRGRGCVQIGSAIFKMAAHQSTGLGSRRCRFYGSISLVGICHYLFSFGTQVTPFSFGSLGGNRREGQLILHLCVGGKGWGQRRFKLINSRGQHPQFCSDNRWLVSKCFLSRPLRPLNVS